jgi:hypothetical protein
MFGKHVLGFFKFELPSPILKMVQPKPVPLRLNFYFFPFLFIIIYLSNHKCPQIAKSAPLGKIVSNMENG